ncbi:hypothetical protein [Kitasatospora cinereorecta]|uniref:Serine/threonine protein kinase n=1 Tax=Kitasatospora cinereorecta TaxID=285560 RepID=A0ABW0VFX2_9ACTN
MAGSIDIHSTGYVSYRALVWFLRVGGAAGTVWWLTRKWRRPVAATPEEAPGAAALGRKRTRSLALGLAAAVTLAVVAIGWYAARSTGPGPSVAFGPTDRSINAPDTVAGYHLITGKAAARITTEQHLEDSPEQCWFYSKAQDGITPDLVFCGSSVHGDPAAASARAGHSYDWLFREFFAGARIDDAAQVDAGPLGGQLRCGHLSTNGVALCHWEDDATTGSLMTADSKALQDTATFTRQFRESAEH